MPNRVLRDWTTSETIDTLSLGAEVFFTRLIMKADDYGNYTANLKLLRSALFPLKNYEDCQVEIWLNECAKAKVILIYCSEGKSYIHIPNFGQRLRAMKSQYPDYVSTNDRQLTVNGRLETKRNETEKETEFESREKKTLAWFESQIDEIYLENLKMTHKGKDIQQAIKEAYNHVASDSLRLHNLDGAGAKRLVNTWLTNMKATNGKPKTQLLDLTNL